MGLTSEKRGLFPGFSLWEDVVVGPDVMVMVSSNEGPSVGKKGLRR